MSQTNGTTTKKELVNRIAGELGEKKVLVKDVIQHFLDAIIDELALGKRLEFREFGVFEVRERAARMAQNPRTLDKVQVPAKRVVKFKVGRRMRQLVCDGEADTEPRAARASEDSKSQNASSGFAASTPPNLNPDSKFG